MRTTTLASPHTGYDEALMVAVDEEQDDDPSLDRLTGDLRTLVGLRSRTSVRDRPLPELDRHVTDVDLLDRDGRYLARQRLVDEAIAAMSDTAHRQAAEELLSIGPLRWQPLTRRGAAAAAAFGLGWDGYRRRRATTGTSLLDETVAELATTIVSLTAPGSDRYESAHEASDGDPSPPADSHPRVSDRSTARRRRIIAAAVAVAIVLAAGSLIAARNGGTRSLRTGSRQQCGTLVEEIGSGSDAPSLAPWREPFRAAALHHGADNFRCAALMKVRQIDATGESFVYQEVSTGATDPISALVGSSTEPGEVIWFDPVEWGVALDGGTDNPARTLGAPVERIDTGSPDRRAIRFTNGLIHRESSDGPGITVLGAFYEHWLDSGGFDGDLGAPLGSAVELGIDAGRQQAFTGGLLQRGYDLDAELTIVPYDDETRSLGDASESIVTAEDGVSWWIDDQGERHWIRTTCAYHRLQSNRARAVVKRSAIAVLDLPIGPEVATC